MTTVNFGRDFNERKYQEYHIRALLEIVRVLKKIEAKIESVPQIDHKSIKEALK